jgi:hypothetical protein
MNKTLNEKIQKLKEEHATIAIAQWKDSHKDIAVWLEEDGWVFEYDADEDEVSADKETSLGTFTVYLGKTNVGLYAELDAAPIAAYIDEEITYDTLIEDLEDLMKIIVKNRTIKIQFEVFDNVPEKFAENFITYDDVIKEISNSRYKVALET